MAGQLILADPNDPTVLQESLRTSPLSGAQGLETLRQAGQMQAGKVAAPRHSPFSLGQSAPGEEPDSMSFFKERPIPVSDPTLFKPYEDQWFREFANRFQDRQFQDLDDYVDFVKNLPGADPRTLSYVQRQAQQFMPAHIREEFEGKKAQAAEEKAYSDNIRRQVRAQQEISRLGEGWGADGSGVLKYTPPKKTAADRKLDMLKTLGTLKSKELSGSADDFITSRIDTIIAELEEQLLADSVDEKPQRAALPSARQAPAEPQVVQFNSVEEANTANVPKGTIVVVGDRKFIME